MFYSRLLLWGIHYLSGCAFIIQPLNLRPSITTFDNSDGPKVFSIYRKKSDNWFSGM